MYTPHHFDWEPFASYSNGESRLHNRLFHKRNTVRANLVTFIEIRKSHSLQHSEHQCKTPGLSVLPFPKAVCGCYNMCNLLHAIPSERLVALPDALQQSCTTQLESSHCKSKRKIARSLVCCLMRFDSSSHVFNLIHLQKCFPRVSSTRGTSWSRHLHHY